ncbi:MAG: aromatic amino acid ammonia-lyase [Synergistaceae bacterium]|nr:aromatic amino acid ammonia-lyase [Synergistaceae bacterium]
MNRASSIKEVCLGGEVRLCELIAVARYGAKVSFNDTYKKRVMECRKLVENLVKENRRIYGVTTGLGDNVKRVIPEKDAIKYQENMILTHCTNVGEPLDREAVRAIIFVMLLNMGSGYSGVRLEILEHLAEFLNKNIIPWTPAHGSVGYLGAEAHIAMVLLGKGRAYYNGELLDGAEALKCAGTTAINPSYKEGLSLISGGTSATALAALAAYDAANLTATADVVASCTLEALGGNLTAFDERIMGVKHQPEQWISAQHVNKILKDSAVIKEFGGQNLQDALSLRCIPQAHGAVRKTVSDALRAVENELNSCDDNPIIHPSGEALSGCNCDAGFIGIESDSICIAMGYLAKISERRTDRMLNEHVSGLPPFLVASAGENSGYMILQYSSAALLGELRVLAHPASVDSVPTCAFQEDYVSMGYNAALKARQVVRLAEYILGNELLTAAQAAELRIHKECLLSSVTAAVNKAVREKAPFMENDHYISPDMEWAMELVHSGRVRAIAEEQIGLMS